MPSTESALAGLADREKLRDELANLRGGKRPGLRTIHRYESQGLPVIKRGNLRLYDLERVRAWLAAGEVGGLKRPRRRRRAAA